MALSEMHARCESITIVRRDCSPVIVHVWLDGWFIKFWNRFIINTGHTFFEGGVIRIQVKILVWVGLWCNSKAWLKKGRGEGLRFDCKRPVEELRWKADGETSGGGKPLAAAMLNQWANWGLKGSTDVGAISWESIVCGNTSYGGWGALCSKCSASPCSDLLQFSRLLEAASVHSSALLLRNDNHASTCPQ